MTHALPPRDLIVLVPDVDMEFAVRGILERPDALGIRPITFDAFRHAQRDAGCRSDCHNFLRMWLREYRYAMVLFDHEGCGKENIGRAQLERKVEGVLSRNGWTKRSAVIVIDPELEAWVWSDSPAVDEVLGWSGQLPGLRPYLQSVSGLWRSGRDKPERPKEALVQALRTAGKPPSPSLFADLAARVSTDRCADPAFRKFRGKLQGWFGA